MCVWCVVCVCVCVLCVACGAGNPPFSASRTTHRRARAGAGKSTLINALFRLADLCPTDVSDRYWPFVTVTDRYSPTSARPTARRRVTRATIILIV